MSVNSQRNAFDAWWEREGRAFFESNEGWRVAFAAWQQALAEQPAGPAEREDTQRLDWVIANRCTIYSGETRMHWVVVDETKKSRRGNVAPTLREAIDKASGSVATEDSGQG